MLRLLAPLTSHATTMRMIGGRSRVEQRLARVVLALVVSAGAVVLSCGGAAPPPKTEPRPRAPVVVAIVVDQLSAWVASSRLPLLPPDGAFAKLRAEGTWVKNLRYPYAATDTAPGHASLHTGKVPAEHGLFANDLPDAAGNRGSILRDPRTQLVAADGIRTEVGSSAARLRAPTVADRLRAARPDALVISVSLKDRAAILPAGQHPTHAIWFGTAEGAFVTSTAFEKELPRWAAERGNAAAVERARSVPWTPTDKAWLESHAGIDDQPGEGDLAGLGTTFPHLARSSVAFRATPMSDAMILDIALAGVLAEYDPEKPTLILVSITSSDVIGHVFGPDSWEAWDQLRKLDQALAGFLSALETRVGPVRVLLSGDHGTVSMPEKLGSGGIRIGPNAVRDELKAEAARVFGAGGEDLIAGTADPWIFLSEKGRALEPADRAKLDGVVRKVLAKYASGIVEIFDVRELVKTCPQVLARAPGIPERAKANEPLVALVCRSVPVDIPSGDYFVVPKDGSFWDSELVVGKGTSHGTPWLHDRTVPMLVRAPGIVAHGITIEDPVDFSAFASLEAALLDLDDRTPSAILAATKAR